MIARDRELLTRLGKVNASIGEVALALMAAQDGGKLPADGLREVGEALRTLAIDMIARADEVNEGMPVSLAASPTTTCALCHAEPVARPDRRADTVEGRFCGDCVARCLDDPRRDHWCPIDTLARADEVPTDA
ncbi:hypothetical protein AB8O38_17335 [Saccharomonospora xinjiangensis]|uniref:hypothetical protein n=1 Tax=Saccharomonospora xinjiangensis TaxID=75294 RepID=UPI00350E9B15